MTGKRFKLIGDSNLEMLMQHQLELPIYDYQNNKKRLSLSNTLDLLNSFNDENEQLKQSNERIVKDIDLALGFIRHKGYSLQDIKDYEDAKKEYEEDLAYYRKGDVE